MTRYYQPSLPFKPRLRLKKTRGLVKMFLDSQFIADGKAKMTGNHVGYRTTTGRYYLFCFDHPEKTPSLCISKRRNEPNGEFHYHCFGCGKVGSMARLGQTIKKNGYTCKGIDLTVVYAQGRLQAINGHHGRLLDSESKNINNPGGGIPMPPPVDDEDDEIPF